MNGKVHKHNLFMQVQSQGMMLLILFKGNYVNERTDLNLIFKKISSYEI